MRKSILLILAALLAIAAIASACKGSASALLNQKAQFFAGGTPTGIGGTDSGNAGAVAAATAMSNGRSFDLTPSGFVIGSGAISSTPASGSAFGVGSGTLAVSGDTATVDLDVVSTDPNVTNAHLAGTFSLAAAVAAMATPGQTFDMHWHATFNYLTVPVSLTFTQPLSGTDFTNS